MRSFSVFSQQLIVTESLPRKALGWFGAALREGSGGVWGVSGFVGDMIWAYF